MFVFLNTRDRRNIRKMPSFNPVLPLMTQVSYVFLPCSPPLSHRREVHTNAEQRRRGSLKNGFEQMRALIPSLRENANLKISKAALLQKGGEHLQQLKEDRLRMAKEAARLRAEADALDAELAAYQGALSSRSAAASGPSTASTLA